MTLLLATFCTALYISPIESLLGGCVPSNKNLALVTRPEFECMSLKRNEWDSTAPFLLLPRRWCFLEQKRKRRGIASYLMFD